MGQSSISYLNKNGYSMFWNSMWDNKINYNKNIKEDLFLKNFFPYIFKDNITKNIDLKLKSYNNFNFKNIKLQKSLIYNNKLEFYMFRLWILKYQFWVILYNYIYICNFSKQNEFFIDKISSNYLNFFIFYKINLKMSKQHFFFDNLKKKLYF